ncbi:MAG: thioredoxin family protein [Planctomycetota bacterium]|nr:thioredoxin family protein [Planctomycetota bacterium]
MGPKLEEIVKLKGNLRLRKIEIPRGPSDVGKQYSITSVPTLWLYEGDKLIANQTREVLGLITRH